MLVFGLIGLAAFGPLGAAVGGFSGLFLGTTLVLGNILIPIIAAVILLGFGGMVPVWKR